MISDWEYLKAARSGDQEAFTYIFNKYNKPLLNMAVLITGSVDSAKDVVQESFIRLFNVKINHTKGNFKSYLTTIVFRFALKEKGRVKKNKNIDEIDLIGNSSSPEDKSMLEEEQTQIYRAITSLPDNQKDILILRFYGDVSYEVISEILRLPLGTVKSRIFYGVKACREKLKEQGVLE